MSPKNIQGMSTQGNVDIGSMEAAFVFPKGGLDAAAAMALYFKVGELPQRVSQNIMFADKWGSFKQSRCNAGSRRAVAIGNMPAVVECIFLQVAAQGDSAPPTASIGIPHTMSDDKGVPLDKLNPAILIDEPVPDGFQMWITGFAFDLFPQTINELNYHWSLNLNGQDALNKHQRIVNFGRPIISPQFVPLGYDKSSWVLAQPGTVIDVTVIAKSAIAASDRVRACVFGFLEPAT